MLDIAIIGGGPAGLSAGLYAARGGAYATLFEELYAGGQAAKTHQIDNYPGFSDGIEGFLLGAQIEQQATRFGLTIEYAAVEQLILEGDEKKIVLSGRTVEAKTIVLAMGASPKKLGVEREAELTGAGVSYCATCDGAFFKGKNVAVVGGGDTAIADALYLSRFAEKVYVVHRRDQLRAGEALQKAARAEEKIEFIWDSVVTALLGQTQIEGLTVKNVRTGLLRPVNVAGVFVAVGIEPRTELVRDQLTLSPNGSIVTDSRMQTSVPGVFAAGDIRDTVLRQVVTACADGAVAATNALDHINHRLTKA